MRRRHTLGILGWPARLRSRFDREEGVSLVELVITVSILSLVLAFTTKSFVSLQQAATGDRLRLQNLEGARLLMDIASKDIRTATRLSSTTAPFDVGSTSQGLPTAPAPGTGNGTAPPYAGATEVWFYANLNLNTTSPDPCPSIVHLFLDTSSNPTQVKEQVLAAQAGGTPPACVYSGSYTTRVVAKSISSATTIFTYYYDDGSGTPAAFASGSVPLTATDRLLVNAIGISLSVNESTSPNIPATTIVNRTRLPNVYYNPADSS